MVKSNPAAMPKRRKILVDPELLRELEDLERRMRETDKETAVTMERARIFQEKLRAIYLRRR